MVKVVDLEYHCKNNRPIFVLGFGRSGTTWISDVISRTLCGILLFEPFHPKMKIGRFAYQSNLDNIARMALKYHIQNLLDGHIIEPWVLRNSLPYDISKIEDDTFLKYFEKYIRKTNRILRI